MKKAAELGSVAALPLHYQITAFIKTEREKWQNVKTVGIQIGQ